MGPSVYNDFIYGTDIEKGRLLKNTVGTTA